MAFDVIDDPATRLTAVLAPAPRPALSRALRALQARATAIEGANRSQTAASHRQQPVDVARLSEQLRGRAELIRRTLTLFRGECERGVTELCHRIDAADLAGAAESAHRIKGAAGSAAAEPLREAASRVEEACRRGRADDVIAGFAELEREAGRVEEQLHRTLTEGQQA